MNLMNRLTNHNLKLNKKRTIMTILGIILSVALLTAVATMVVSFRVSLLKYEGEINGYFNYAFFDVPKEDLDNFKNNRSIESYYTISNLGYFSLDTKNNSKPYGYIVGMDANALKNSALHLVDGRLPENENEVVISKHVIYNGGVKYKVGDVLDVSVGERKCIADDDECQYFESKQDFSFFKESEELIVKENKKYKIVGIVERPSFFVEPYSAPGYSFITLVRAPSDISNVFAKYTKDAVYNRHQVTADFLGITDPMYVESAAGYNMHDYAKKHNMDLEKAYNKLNAIILAGKYNYDENVYYNNLEGNPFKEVLVQALLSVAAVVIVIIIVTSVYCIKNSFDISITEKTKLYGMLRSVGATKGQIRKNVLYEACVLGMIGIPFGLFFGNFAAFVLIQITNYLLSDALTFNLVFSISMLGVITSILLGALTIFLSAIRSARKASRISPIVAIRSNDDINIKRNKIKSNKLIKKLFGIGGTISNNNIKRNRKKYRATVVSIVVVVATFIGLNEFMNLAFKVVDLETRTYSYNGEITTYNKEIDNEGVPIKQQVLDFVKNNTDIEEYSTVSNFPVNLRDFKLTDRYNKITDNEYTKENWYYANIVSLDNKSFNKVLKDVKLTKDELKDGAILINKYQGYDENGKHVETNILDVKVSSTIKVVCSGEYDDDGNLLSEDIRNIKVAGITELRTMGLDMNTDEVIFIVNKDYYEDLFDDEQINIYIKSSNVDKVQEDMEKVIPDDSSWFFYNVDKEYRTTRSLFILIAIFLYGFIIVIALIGITNIYNTITTNVYLRRREFAMLKSIGMTKDEFNRMVRLESLFLGVKSLIIGVPLGLLLGYGIYRVLIVDVAEFGFIFPIEGILISIVVVFLLIFSLMNYSVKKINKQNIIETIRNENI